MTTAVIYENWVGFGPTSGSRAVSDDSKALQRSYEQGLDRLRETITLGQKLKDALVSLVAVSEEASVDNWDSYGAKPLAEAAISEAYRFLQMWPSSLSFPEVAAEPDGDIALEWIEGRRQMFSISFSGSSRITYAGVFGINEVHGTEYFGDVIPKVVLDSVRRVLV